MRILGVFQTVFPDGNMDIGRALLISFIGFVTVILVLLFLAVFVTCMGKLFEAINAKKAAAAPDAPVTAANEPVKSEVTLIDVSEQDAAVIMAIVSRETDIPLERLKFNYIKSVEEN